MKDTLPSAIQPLTSSEGRTRPDFDRLAHPYRWLEYLAFGPLLQRTRTHFLPQLSACRSALVLGDGDGRFTAALMRTNPRAQVHAVDISPAMLHALTRAVSDPSRLTTEEADLRAWTPTLVGPCDAVTTHFFLDCLTTSEIASLAARLGPSTTPDALWIVSDFAIPATLFGRLVAAPLVTLLYRAFGILTGLQPQSLPDHATALTGAGWTLQSHHERVCGLLVSQTWCRSLACIPEPESCVS
jgi:hypothetical protein